MILAQVFSSEYWKIFKNTLFYRTSPVAASSKIRTKSLKLAKFQFQLLLTTLDIMGSLYIVTYSCKTRYPQKIFVILSIHIAIQTSNHLTWNKNSLQWYVVNHVSFLNDLSVKSTSNIYKPLQLLKYANFSVITNND